MLFTHDTEIALQAAAALVNTATAPDSVDTPEALDRFVEEWGWTGQRRHDDKELQQVRRLRPRLRDIWVGTEQEIVDGVNALLVDARALPQLVRHDQYDWHLHATSSEAPLAERMAVEAAMALVDVVRAGEISRLRTCAAQDCDDVLIDLSRNRSKRYCDGGCGNRVAAAAYRARQQEGTGS
ncbi:CGNR zinc finger domain-containing protein [Ornithinicoccus hortensis]|uniref:Putative RNA-binding Zn ribbon-like protein n=1 Tax=Ornithinicoccus hortensis TaxID=82346 RepID=A0A542YM32_9MICO|nr:CGNR zinc finger domain-containing protein [Ornithinicoccus hortensis]TQL49148.1 putative RNA-binding Zn ribbon-like protein [Ornithinicoccus hortensis]